MSFAVFFPSLMGVGILVSGALLLSDLIRRLLPTRGLHRRHRVAMGTFGVVSDAATWTGKPLSAGELLDRAPRSRFTYAIWTVMSAAIAVTVPAGLTIAYRDELGLFHRSPWMVGLGTAGGILFGLLTLLLVAVTVCAGRRCGPVAWLIGHTVLGRLQVPDEETKRQVNR